MAKDRLGSISKGMKSGAVKRAVDKAVSPITAPVAEAINAKLAEMHPNMQFTAPMIEVLMQSAIIIGLAEMVDMATPALGGKLPIDAEKLSLISEFMREYAGEKFGGEIVESAVKIAPMIINSFAEFSADDIREALPDGKRSLVASTISQDMVLPKLIEEDEEVGEEELFEKVPVIAEPVHAKPAIRKIGKAR